MDFLSYRMIERNEKRRKADSRVNFYQPKPVESKPSRVGIYFKIEPRTIEGIKNSKPSNRMKKGTNRLAICKQTAVHPLQIFPVITTWYLTRITINSVLSCIPLQHKFILNTSDAVARLITVGWLGGGISIWLWGRCAATTTTPAGSGTSLAYLWRSVIEFPNKTLRRALDIYFQPGPGGGRGDGTGRDGIFMWTAVLTWTKSARVKVIPLAPAGFHSRASMQESIFWDTKFERYCVTYRQLLRPTLYFYCALFRDDSGRYTGWSWFFLSAGLVYFEWFSFDVHDTVKVYLSINAVFTFETVFIIVFKVILLTSSRVIEFWNFLYFEPVKYFITSIIIIIHLH